MSRLAAGMSSVIAIIAATAAVASDRIAMVGTPVSLIPPSGFSEGGDPGLANGDGVHMRAFPMPSHYLFEDGLAADDRLAPFFGLDGFASLGPPVASEPNGALVYLEGGTLPDGRQAWVAVFNVKDNAALTFVAPSAGSFDRNDVEAVLASVRLSQGVELPTGGAVQGVLLPLVAPFADVDVATGITKSVVLSLREEKGRDKGAPHIDLFFPARIGEALSLEELAGKYLELDVSHGSSSPAVLLGATAIRQDGTAYLGSREVRGVGYLAVIGGQTVVLFGRGPKDEMTDEIVAAIDKAAAALTRYVPNEGEE